MHHSWHGVEYEDNPHTPHHVSPLAAGYPTPHSLTSTIRLPHHPLIHPHQRATPPRTHPPHTLSSRTLYAHSSPLPPRTLSSKDLVCTQLTPSLHTPSQARTSCAHSSPLPPTPSPLLTCMHSSPPPPP